MAHLFRTLHHLICTDSRRLYYKKKQQKNQLQDQIRKLQSHNEKLRKDNEWLEGLLAEAQLHVDVAASDDDLLNPTVDNTVMADFELLTPTEISTEVLPGERG